MVNREYIKSQIDILPEDVVVIINKLINENSKKLLREKSKKEEYWTQIDNSIQELKDGKGITFEWEEWEAMSKMPPEQAKEFTEKIKARGKV